MLLVLEIAAGIVLGYTIIRNQHAILKVLKELWGWLLAAIGFAAAFWLLGSAYDVAKPYVGPYVGKALIIVATLAFFGVGFAGAYGLWLLGHEILHRKPTQLGEKVMPTVLVCIAVVNMLSLYLIAQPLLDYTAVGDWYNALDRWSRTNGFADGGTGAVACVFFLWPFIPLHFIRKYRASKSVAPRTRVDTHH